MQVVLRRLPLPQSYYAINLFGIVFARRPLSGEEMRHELIHSRQQRELLYVFFFLWYGAEWLWGLLRYRSWWQAYRQIRFEREAYRHEADVSYLEHRPPYQFLRER